MSKKLVHLDDIWPPLEDGLMKLLRDLNEGMDAPKWMELYTYVFILIRSGVGFPYPMMLPYE